MFRHATICCLAIVLCTRAAHAEWAAPNNGIVTDKQVAAYVQIMKQLMTSIKKIDKTIEGETGLVSVTATLRGTAIFERALAGNGMTEAEFDWVKDRVAEAWRAINREQKINKFKDYIADGDKTIQHDLAVARQRLALHQKALKDGRRVLDAAQRKSIAEASAEAQKSALAEAAQRADESKSAEADAARLETEAKALEAALKNPPKFADEDSRKAFIAEKTDMLRVMKDAKARAQFIAADARKAEARSRAEAAAYAARAKDPEVAINDDDKAAARGENENAIKELGFEITRTETDSKVMAEDAAKRLKSLTDDPRYKAPAPNMAVLRNHRSDYEALLGVKK